MIRSRPLYLLVVAIIPAQHVDAQCGGPMPVDSVEARIRNDIASRWEGSYALFASEHWMRLGTLGPQVRHLTYWRDPRPGRYQVAVGADGAYALRGWGPPCDAVEEWVNTLGPLPVSTPQDVWATLADLAAAMNPVGTHTRLLDRLRETGLTADRIVTDSIPGVEEVYRPVLRTLQDGTREGQVSVFWSNEGYHGMALALWRFRFDANGVLVYLLEEDLLNQSSVRRLVG